MDRREAIDFCATKQDDAAALNLLKLALKDPYFGLREYTLSQLDVKKSAVMKEMEPLILDLAKNDKKSVVRAKAISLLGTYNNTTYKPVFANAVNDSSYSVAGAALQALSVIDE